MLDAYWKAKAVQSLAALYSQDADYFESLAALHYFFTGTKHRAGHDHTVLSEFRTRQVEGKMELVLLDVLLERVRALGLLKLRGKQRTDSTHVLASVRTMNRLERVGETLRAALNNLAVEAPKWLTMIADPEWFKRYGRRIENFNLPKTEAARAELAAEIGGGWQEASAAI